MKMKIFKQILFCWLIVLDASLFYVGAFRELIV